MQDNHGYNGSHEQVHNRKNKLKRKDKKRDSCPVIYSSCKSIPLKINNNK